MIGFLRYSVDENVVWGWERWDGDSGDVLGEVVRVVFVGLYDLV